MNDDGIDWVSSNILKVSGDTARTGLVTSREGKTIEFTEDDLKDLCQNFVEPIPLYLTHDDKTPCGFINKLGYEKATDKLKLMGFVFDKKKAEKIQEDGYNKISPEITVDRDDITGKIKRAFMTAGAFVKVPMFDNSPVSTIPVCFGDPIAGNTVKSYMTENTNTAIPTVKANADGSYTVEFNKGTQFTDTTTGTSSGYTYQPPIVVNPPTVTTPVAPIDEDAIVKKVKAALEGEYAPLKTELESTKAAASDYKTKYEGVLTDKLNSTLEELKSLGVVKPEDIGADLPIEQRIGVLSNVKTNIVKASPSTTPVTTPVTVATPQSNKVDDVLKEIGISKDFLAQHKIDLTNLIN